MKIKAFIFSAFLLITSLAKAEVRHHMDEMLTQIFILKPYIISQPEFVAPKNSPLIAESLKKMVTISKSINHEDRIKNTAFQIPAKMLQQQLKESEIVFRTGNKDYALWLLRSTLSNCMACHTQVPAVSTHFQSMNDKHVLSSSFDEAEFLFVVRNFDKAMEFYSQSIAEFPANKIISNNIEKAIFRKIYYFVRVKRDLKSLSASLKKDSENKKLSVYLKDILNKYQKAADQLASQKELAFADDQALRTYAQETLKMEFKGQFATDDAEKNLINLRLSGYLYEYLNKNPESTLRPEVYYWLSFCENRWQGFAFDSLPDMYLKKCIMEFPKSTIAGQCYKEYKELVTMAYTGSSGTNIPADVSKELESLKSMIEKIKN